MSTNAPRKHGKRYTKEIKEKVVMHIVNGDYLLDEVMEIYEISSSKTVIHWLREYMRKKKKGMN